MHPLLLTLALSTLAAPIAWQPWSDDVFHTAQAQQRLVLLDLEAVWCHWCHVMDAQTYHDPKIQRLINERFLAVRVDQDSRPDLANRYERYGWPATIVFDGAGRELAKRSGYLGTQNMAALLESLVANPVPEQSAGPETAPVPGPTRLDAGLQARLEGVVSSNYDTASGGYALDHKFLDRGLMEWSMRLAADRQAAGEKMAKQILDAQRALLDPVWGGVYQYSTDGGWSTPHFEKIMQVQADNIVIYARAYAQWKNAKDLDMARAVTRYLDTFLRGPGGAFFTSQDADLVQGQHSADYFALNDAARRKRGMPRIDRHQYTRENAWVARSRAELYAAAGDPNDLEAATRAAHWILAHRKLATGGFGHDAHDAAGPYLGDNVAAGEAFLALYACTGVRTWLREAQAVGSFIASTFRAPSDMGWATATARPNAPWRPRPQLDENVAVARFANLLARYSGDPVYRGLADTAMRFAASPEIASELFAAAPVLVAAAELSREPVHIVVVGPRSHAQTQALLRAANAYPEAYKQVELFDRAEGPLPGATVEYPDRAEPAAYACSGKQCSPPATDATDLRARVEKLEAAAR